VQTRVDDLEAGVSKRSSDDLRPAIVAIQSRLGYEYSNFVNAL
jgi:hypothetical protein